MNDHISEVDDDLVASMFGSVTYTPASPEIERPFLPWHRPRKQYVRRYQWINLIKRLLRDLIRERKKTGLEVKELSYLGLPGVDLIDLRCIHNDVCIENEIKLVYLGFVSEAQPSTSHYTELAISIDEVSRLPFIDPLSSISTDHFERIANASSMAYQKAKKIGPFDIINLDLCNGFGSHAPDAIGDSYYSAITRLLTMQSKRNDPWILFLTTRVDHKNINEKAIEEFLKLYSKNLENSKEFKKVSEEFFGISCDLDALDAVTSDGEGMLNVFMTGVCKFIIEYCLGLNPPVIMQASSVFGYSVEKTSDVEDMVSIALHFKPTLSVVNRNTAFGAVDNIPDEGALAAQAVSKIAERKNVDGILSEDPIAREEMEREMSNLLVMARYNAENFKVWCSETA